MLFEFVCDCFGNSADISMGRFNPRHSINSAEVKTICAVLDIVKGAYK